MSTDKTFENSGSPLYDGLVVVGSGVPTPQFPVAAAQQIFDAFLHKKPLGAFAGAEPLVQRLYSGEDFQTDGLVLGDGQDLTTFVSNYLLAMKVRRFWARPDPTLL